MEYDVIIIGAGISGITCGIYLKRAGKSVLVIENSMVGGQLNKVGVIENYPGYVNVTGSDLAFSLQEQLFSNNIDMINDEIDVIDYDDREIKIGNSIYRYEYLVFATGRRERMLNLDNEDKFIGRGISFCATCDGAIYSNRDVIVVGGGNSAVSEALYLSNICRCVYLIYRGSELRSEEILKDRVSNCNNIKVIYNANVKEYLVDNDIFAGVSLDNGKNISADCVFLAIGSIPNSDLFMGNKDNGYIVVDKDGMSSIDNVFAIGDVVKKDIYQLITASNDGVVVANSIINRGR